MVSGNMMSEIIDRLNLWHYEDDDEREEGAGLFENGMERMKESSC